MEAPPQGRRQAYAPTPPGGETGPGPAKIVFWLMTGLTAVALAAVGVELASADRAPAADHGAEAAADAALVRRFYDAVNATLATGDPAALAALLAADFADRSAHPADARGPVGLVQQLLALRTTFPTLWFVVEELHPHGDWVLARVRVEGAAPGAFLGLTVTGGPASWEAVELVRVAGGRIVERRAASDWPALPQPLVAAPLPGPPPAAFVRLGRLTYGPGASQPRTAALGPLLVAVEAGTLTAQVEGEAVLTRAAAGTSGPPSAGDVLLGAGDALVLPSGTWYAVRNDGRLPAVVLTLALLPGSPGTPEGKPSAWWESWLPDVTAQLLAEGAVADLPAGSATVALGRVTLAAQAELVEDGAAGLRLAAVEAGTLHLATSSGAVTLLSAGQGTPIQPASDPTFRNAGEGPLVVLLVTITPSGPATGTGIAHRGADLRADGTDPVIPAGRHR